jgi:hypothetical protein
MWVGIAAVVLSAAWLWYRHRRGWGAPMIRPDDAPAPDEKTATPARRPEATAG